MKVKYYLMNNNERNLQYSELIKVFEPDNYPYVYLF